MRLWLPVHAVNYGGVDMSDFGVMLVAAFMGGLVIGLVICEGFAQC